MKVFFITLFLFFTANICSAQILKELGKRIKGDAEWRVRYKADHRWPKDQTALWNCPPKKSIRRNQKLKQITKILPVQKNKLMATIQIQNKLATTQPPTYKKKL